MDCDNTLWAGTIAEDKLSGINITESRKKFQLQLIKRQKAGLLLCLCSKNTQDDVLEVLNTNSSIKMPLSLSHIAAWEINWKDKATNIRALAKKLNIGLDSILFINDNPVECEKARIECPEVLTLQMPLKEQEIATFIDDLWLLDAGKISEEDKYRTQMIQEDLKRKVALQASRSFGDFISSLSLKIVIAEARNETVPRIA